MNLTQKKIKITIINLTKVKTKVIGYVRNLCLYSLQLYNFSLLFILFIYMGHTPVSQSIDTICSDRSNCIFLFCSDFVIETTIISDAPKQEITVK